MLDLFESMSPMDVGAIVGSSGSIDALQRKLKKRHFVDCSLKEVGSGIVKLKVGKTLPGDCGDFTYSNLGIILSLYIKRPVVIAWMSRPLLSFYSEIVISSFW